MNLALLNEFLEQYTKILKSCFFDEFQLTPEVLEFRRERLE